MLPRNFNINTLPHLPSIQIIVFLPIICCNFQQQNTKLHHQHRILFTRAYPIFITIMSLPRVGSLETFLSIPAEGERSRRGSITSNGTSPSIRPRRLSFNPLPESWVPIIPKDIDHPGNTIGAFEVPEWKRIREFFLLNLVWRYRG